MSIEKILMEALEQEEAKQKALEQAGCNDEFKRECDEIKEKYPDLDRLAGMIVHKAFPKADLPMFYQALESFPESLTRNMIKVITLGHRMLENEMNRIADEKFTKTGEAQSESAEQ